MACPNCGSDKTRFGKTVHMGGCNPGVSRFQKGNAAYGRAKEQDKANANSTAKKWLEKNIGRVDDDRKVPGHSKGIPAGLKVVVVSKPNGEKGFGYILDPDA